MRCRARCPVGCAVKQGILKFHAYLILLTVFCFLLFVCYQETGSGSTSMAGAAAQAAAWAAAVCALVSLFSVLCLPAGPAAPGELRAVQQTQALFNWQQFSERQDALARRSADLSAQLAGNQAGGARDSARGGGKGAAIKEVLRSLMHGLQRGGTENARRPEKKYVPMDQELEILKVHKQMRTEHKFGSDRIEGGGDVAAVVNEAELADERSALMEDPDMGPGIDSERSCL